MKLHNFQKNSQKSPLYKDLVQGYIDEMNRGKNCFPCSKNIGRSSQKCVVICSWKASTLPEAHRNIPHPLSRKRLYPPVTKGGGHTHLRVRGWGSQCGRLEKKPDSVYSVGYPFIRCYNQQPCLLICYRRWEVHQIWGIFAVVIRDILSEVTEWS